jgi:hypothetical protein
MWWRSLALLLAGGVLGTGFGVALGFFLFPFVFPPPSAAERLTEADRGAPILAEGTFIHANPADPIHWGKGRVTVRQDSVYLGRISRSDRVPSTTSTWSPRRRSGPPATCAIRCSPERRHLVRAVLGPDLAGRSRRQKLS